jgi:hypothetical protein
MKFLETIQIISVGLDTKPAPPEYKMETLILAPDYSLVSVRLR